jgi:hypothetical protein
MPQAAWSGWQAGTEYRGTVPGFTGACSTAAPQFVHIMALLLRIGTSQVDAVGT